MWAISETRTRQHRLLDGSHQTGRAQGHKRAIVTVGTDYGKATWDEVTRAINRDQNCGGRTTAGDADASVAHKNTSSGRRSAGNEVRRWRSKHNETSRAT